MFLIFCVLIVNIVTFTYVQLECHFGPLNIRPTPLFLDSSAQLIYPSSRNQRATIKENQQLLIACPGNNVVHNGTVAGPSISLICEDNIFMYGPDEIAIESLKCQDIPRNFFRYTKKSCAANGQEIEIGYELTPNFSLMQIRICFDNVRFTPIYSQFNLTKNIGYRDGKVPRKDFEESGFYSTGESLDYLYRRDVERRTINSLLDLDGDSEEYVKRSGELFINRGHLTAKGDFVYACQQLATFHYVNSAPQWASFNGGNWNELEISVRDFAHSSYKDLEVYTGVYGISSLINQRSGERVPLFLYAATNGRKQVPIPQLFWKIVYDRKELRGIVAIGINNAYKVDESVDIVCDDLSERITWFNSKLRRQKRSIQLGYIYACSVPEFRNAVRIDAPDLVVSDLLL